MELRCYSHFLIFQEMADVFIMSDTWLTFYFMWLSLYSILIYTVFIDCNPFETRGGCVKEWKLKPLRLLGLCEESVWSRDKYQAHDWFQECASPHSTLTPWCYVSSDPRGGRWLSCSSLALRSRGATFSSAIYSLPNFEKNHLTSGYFILIYKKETITFIAIR